MEVLSGPERRRRWSTAEKLAIIHETYGIPTGRAALFH